MKPIYQLLLWILFTMIVVTIINGCSAEKKSQKQYAKQWVIDHTARN